MSTQPTLPQCCLCGNWLQFGSKALYGYQVCPKCHSDFAWKRAFAHLIDIVALTVAVWALVIVVMIIGFVIIGIGNSTAGDKGATAGAIIFIFLYAFVFLATYGLFLIRDGLNGQSPGKRVLALQVINKVSGVPAHYADSFKRNLPLLVPVLPIIVVVQIFTGNGIRIGDEWAQTKVIWKQYADRAPFLSLSGIQAQARARAAATQAAQPPVTNA